MKPDLDKLQPSERNNIEEALFRLIRNSNDFNILLSFLGSCLENRKTMLITSDIEYVQRLQGEADILKGLFDIIGSTEYRHRNQ